MMIRLPVASTQLEKSPSYISGVGTVRTCPFDADRSQYEIEIATCASNMCGRIARKIGALNTRGAL
jgi:hypothetical protein